jgi:hypothetical protein
LRSLCRSSRHVGFAQGNDLAVFDGADAIYLDGTKSNDDVNGRNNQMSRSGTGINTLFTR